MSETYPIGAVAFGVTKAPGLCEGTLCSRKPTAHWHLLPLMGNDRVKQLQRLLDTGAPQKGLVLLGQQDGGPWEQIEPAQVDWARSGMACRPSQAEDQAGR